MWREASHGCKNEHQGAVGCASSNGQGAVGVICAAFHQRQSFRRLCHPRAGDPINVDFIVPRPRADIQLARRHQRTEQSRVPLHRELVAENEQALPSVLPAQTIDGLQLTPKATNGPCLSTASATSGMLSSYGMPVIQCTSATSRIFASCSGEPDECPMNRTLGRGAMAMGMSRLIDGRDTEFWAKLYTATSRFERDKQRYKFK